jgi:hypothetical protein
MFPGDVQLFLHRDNTFINVESFSNQFKKLWREQRNISFTWKKINLYQKNKSESSEKESTPYIHYFDQDSWSSATTNECVSNGQVAYFEVILAEKRNEKHISMIGAVVGSNMYHVNYALSSSPAGKVRLRIICYSNMKAIFISNKSLYAPQLHDRHEFKRCMDVTSRVGVFIDMRICDNGKMYFVVDGVVQGLMYSHMCAPIYPGVSSRDNLLKAEIVHIHNHPFIPRDWMQLSSKVQDKIGFHGNLCVSVLH